MTGSGTQADPYVPSNWAEFVTAIGTQGAYVSLAEGTVWDMNEIAQSGVGVITVQATQVSGNGAEIKNLYFNGGGFRLARVSPTLMDFRFTNCLAENGTSVFKVSDDDHSLYPNIYRTTFSGKIVDSNLFEADYYSGSQQIYTYRCSINAEFSGNSAFAKTASGSYPCVKLFFDHVKTSGSSTYSSAQQMQIQNTLWEGDWVCKSVGLVGGYSNSPIISSNNVFDVNVPATATVSVNSNYASNVKQCIFNSSKIASGATLAAQITQVTDEQLHSASYLNSIGFPIVVGG